MSILKLSSVRLGGFQANSVVKADGDDLVGTANLRGLLDINGARALDVAGAFADRVDFTIKPERLAGEFTNEKGICTVRFYRDSEESFGLSINPVTLHGSKVVYKDNEHRIRITLSYGKQQHQLLSEFFVANPSFSGYIAISPDQMTLPVGDEAEAEEGETEAEEPKKHAKSKNGKPKKGAAEEVQPIAAGAMKGSTEGAAARPN